MEKIYSMVRRVAGSDIPVLIQGETGTGKDLVAGALHLLSPRKQAPMVILNCGAIAANLIESELFGHKKGAFTGADQDREGAFERADKGTLFLDEIGELPLDLQPKLLRVLEDKRVTRVGDSTERHSDFRLVAATNRVLADAVLEGAFRQDLFYRIGVVLVTMPPLRDRRGDIPLLAEHFLCRKMQEMGNPDPPLRLTPRAREKLMKHNWPGNVRELKNTLDRAVVLADKNQIDSEDLDFIPMGKEDTEAVVSTGSLSLEATEKKVILKALEKHGGNKRKAAEALGVAYSTLWAKMKKYDIPLSASDRHRSSPT